MTTAISARPWVYTAQFRAEPGPPAMKHPKGEEPVAGAQPSPAASSFGATAAEAGIGATVAGDPAQDPQGDAQQGVTGPYREPGLQGGDPAPAMFGDINGDDTLNQDDILELMQAFNTSTAQADLNDDGSVNTADLGMLIKAIRDFNAKQRPDITPGEGPDRDLYPPSSALVGAGDGVFSKQKAASLEPREPLSETIGGGDEPTAQPGVFGDLTGDGVVNGDDYSMLQKSFGSTGGVGDLNGDGRVDTADLGSMIGLMREHGEG